MGTCSSSDAGKSEVTAEIHNKDVGQNDRQIDITRESSDGSDDKEKNERVRDSLMDAEHDGHLEHVELNALRKIQKSVRRTRALGRAITDNHWKFFSQVDTLEENETMHMATFLQNLIQLVPGAKDLVDEHAGGQDADSTEKAAQNVLLEELDVDVDEIHVGSNIKVMEKVGGGSTMLFSFKGAMNPMKAQETIAMMRGDEPSRMTADSMRKLLRATYRTLKTVPNTTHVSVPVEGKLVVVGDIHGQLSDLLNIIDDGGLPSVDNLYLFNGDFVDRGANSVEVITVLMALFCAYPGCVFFNRGNHEDTFVCQNYGFQEEVVRKYDLETFFMFGETFKHLPLFTIIDDAIFVVHGGLFSDENATLKDLNEIDRLDYAAVPPIKFPANTHGKSDEVYKKELFRQFQRDALWSDPDREYGMRANQRGAGVMFGPDVCQKFFATNGLQMVIRSHEMCQFGIDFPYHSSHHIMEEYLAKSASDRANNARVTTMLKNLPLNPKDPLLCTLFSASNYCGGDNEGAYMVLRKKRNDSFQTPAYANDVPNSLLHFTVHRYRQVLKESGEYHHQTAMDLLIRKKRALTLAFRDADLSESAEIGRASQSKHVSLETWSTVMTKVTGLKIRWLALVKSIVPEEALTDDGQVDYMKFLDKLHKHSEAEIKAREEAQTTASVVKTQSIVMDTLYGNTKRVIEKIFFFFDANNDGEISPDEFRAACKTLNEGIALDDSRRLVDIEHMLETMDFNHSGNIDINEFFECFRLLSRYKQTHPGGIPEPARRKSKRSSTHKRASRRLSRDDKALIDSAPQPPQPPN